ncbi:MAG: DUF1097 domain-containing protein [Tenericutes bacterium]|nr:DUF1097 domain-containing protein [Mycoplasmatota bacterium]
MKIDKFLVAVSISIFLLAGLFNLAYVLYANAGFAFNLTGLVVAGFLGWATFYAAGAGKAGLIKGIPSNLTGIFWAVVIVFIWDKIFGFNVFGAFLAVAIGAGMMCFQANVKWLSFIPGAFIGCSTFFALGATISATTLWPAIIGLLVGLLLGYISEQFAKLIHKKLLKG